MKKLRIAVYTLDLPGYACAQLRILQPALHLGDKISLDWCTQCDGDDYRISNTCLDEADLVLFQRSFPQKDTWPLILRALEAGKPIVYDLDDDFFSIPQTHSMARRLSSECTPYVKKLLKRAQMVTVSTPDLKDSLRPLTSARIDVVPNFLPDRFWAPALPPMEPDAPLFIGFAGSSTHEQDLALIEEALVHTAERFGDRIRIVLFGCHTPGLMRLSQTRLIQFTDSYEAYAAALPALGLHIGLAPLLDDTFNRCKSDIKWQEYAACGICGVFSDLPPYARRVRSGENGLLCGPTPADWEQALAQLVEHPSYCRSMALAAQQELLASGMLSKGIGHYWNAWARAARHI